MSSRASGTADAAGRRQGAAGIGLRCGVAAVGVVLAEVQMARRQVGNHGTDRCSRSADGAVAAGVRAVGAQPALTMLGDSTAAGAGACRRWALARAARVGTRGGGRARVELRNAAAAAPSPTTWTARSR